MVAALGHGGTAFASPASMLSVKNLTVPSHMAMFTPPECQLLAATAAVSSVLLLSEQETPLGGIFV